MVNYLFYCERKRYVLFFEMKTKKLVLLVIFALRWNEEMVVAHGGTRIGVTSSSRSRFVIVRDSQTKSTQFNGRGTVNTA